MNSAATRAIFAGIMANALPDDALAALGTVKEIPDVSDSTRFAGSIYQLYNAGILGGADEYGTFHPYDTIRRSEVAVVVLNIADASRRKVSVLKELPEITLYSDYGATKTVKQDEAEPYLKLGWSKTPVVIPADVSVETILNSATLNPMKTNNAELDSIIDGIFAKIIRDDMSTYQKTRAIYLYLMDNCYYGWGAVSWSGKYVMHDDDYVVVMGKHILKTGHGTCDNYSAAFVAMARRIGLNAYFARGYAGNQSGYLDTHEIAIVTIGGVDYSFDPQIDDYNSSASNRTFSLFCRPFSSMGGRYKGYDIAKAKAGFGNFELK
jgi:transglutaminase-like putative cysteine protease